MKSSIFTRFIAIILLLLRVGNSVLADTYTIGWGTATGDNSTNFTATSGTVYGILSFSCAQNGGTTTPAYNSSNNDLRLYYNSGGNGCSITLTPANGVTITGAVITTTTAPTVKYNVNGGSQVTVSRSGSTYTISGISATTSLEIQNCNTSNTQLRIKAIQITYTTNGGGDPLDNDLAVTSPLAVTVGGTADISFATSSTGAMTFTSNNISVATVNASGKVTGVAVGTTTISVSQAADATYAASDVQTVTVNVSAAPSGTTYTKVTDASGLEEGNEYILVYENGTSACVMGEISSTSTKYGTSVSGFTISSNKITVEDETSVNMLTLSVNGSQEGKTKYRFLTSLEGKTLCWNSGNSLNVDNATVASKFDWFLEYSGSTLTITNVGTSTRKLKYNTGSPRFACYESGQSAVALYVKEESGTAPTFIPSSIANQNLIVGETFETPAISVNSGGTLSAESTDEDVATVTWNSSTNKATVTAVGAGETTIKIKAAKNGEYKAGELSFTVTVVAPTIEQNKTSTSLEIGDTEVLTATLTNAGGATVDWTTSDDAIVSISGTGASRTITAMAAGTATITASITVNGYVYSAECTVTVTRIPRTVSFDGSGTMELTVGGETQTRTASPSEGTDAVTYSSSNPAVATVDPSTGEVTAVGEGSCTITASVDESGDYSAAEASYTVNVTDPSVMTYTWDLTTDSYSSADENSVQWTAEFASMTLAKSTSTIAANNYLGGGNEGSNHQTRFYQNQILTFAPNTDYEIIKVEFTGSENSYATTLAGQTWDNASSVSDGTKVTITPTDRTQEFFCTLSNQVRGLGVTVYYKTAKDFAATITGISPASPLTLGNTGTFEVTASYNAPASSCTTTFATSDGTILSVNPTTGAFEALQNGNVEIIVTITTSSTAYATVSKTFNYTVMATSVASDYVIGYNGLFMKASQIANNKRFDYTEDCVLTIDGKKAIDPDPSIVWRIARSGDYYTIYNVTAKKYAASASGENAVQLLDEGTSDAALWTMVYDSASDTYDFINKANSSYLRNNDTYGFSCYKSTTGGPLTLYPIETGPWVYLNKRATNMVVNWTELLTAKTRDVGTIVNWETSDPTTVSISGDGNSRTITGLKKGTATITVSTNVNDTLYTDACVVKVGTMTVFEKITDQSEIETGKQYIIVYETDERHARVMGAITSGNFSSVERLNIRDNTIAVLDEPVNVLTMKVGESSAHYAMQTSLENKYLSFTGSDNKLYVTDDIDETSSWTLTYADGITTITNVSNTGRSIKFNPGNERFANYKSSATSCKAVALYKLVTDYYTFKIFSGSENYENVVVTKKAPTLTENQVAVMVTEGYTPEQIENLPPAVTNSANVVVNGNAYHLKVQDKVDGVYSPFYAPELLTTASNVSYARTAKEWNSLCLPFSLPYEKVTALFGDGAEIYQLTAVDANCQVVFTKFESGTIAAGTPVLVKSIATSWNAEELAGPFDIKGDEPVIFTPVGSSTSGTAELLGSYKEIVPGTVDGSQLYKLMTTASGQCFGKLSATGKVYPFRIYLKYTPPTAQSAPANLPVKIHVIEGTIGDLNKDKMATLSDLTMMINMVNGAEEKTNAADLDGDGDVNGVDVNRLAKILVKSK